MIIKHSLPTIDQSDIKAVEAVLRSRNLAQGKIVEQLEKKLASFIGVKGAVAVSSGSSALHLALLSLGVEKGTEVIIPSYVCLALLNAVKQTGAKPVICDVNEDDFNIAVKEVKRKISKRTKAIIVPHMFGQPAQIDELKKLPVPIIEDCAHSIGATFNGKKVGSFGTLTIFSFYATKMLTTGEGGMVSSNSLLLLKKVKEMRDYDKKDKWGLYFNYKMSDIQAALGLNQLKNLAVFIKKRRQIAAFYTKALANLEVRLPTKCSKIDSVFYRYIIVMNKDIYPVIKKLKQQGINCERPIFKPLHQYLNLKGFPVSSRFWRNSISLPIYPSLKIKTAKKIATAVKKALS